MVFKACKGGVRSGNTLRGLHTLKAKRYGREACLIARTSLSRREVDKLVESSTDDIMIADTLSNTDVLLSLNKRQRWLAPATLHHMITIGSFKSQIRVSMLEKHKLNRRANCVNFVCNKGPLRNVTPTQKRYFSLRTDCMNGVSRRARRNAIGEQNIKNKKTKTSKNQVQTVHAFTESRAGPVLKANLSGATDLYGPLSSSEYKMEVFYPCPKSCSLTFNPKYTDVVIETNADGEQAVRSVVNHTKSRGSRNRTKAVRGQTALMENIDTIVEQDVFNMWEEEDVEKLVNFDCRNESSGWTPRISFEHSRGFHLSENMFAMIVAEAEKAMHLCAGKPRTRKSRKERRRTISKDSGHETKKNKVIHEHGPNGLRQIQEDETLSTPKPEKCYVELEFAKAIISTKESSESALRDKYGQAYGEANCNPRRFVLNVTGNVKSVLSSSVNTTKLPYTSFIVFIHDSYYGDGKDVFKVSFNSYVIKNQECAQKISHAFNFDPCTIDALMNQLFIVLTDLKTEHELSLPKLQISSFDNRSSRVEVFPSKKTKLSYEVYRTEDEISRVSLQEVAHTDTKVATKQKDLDMFCDICYELVNCDQCYSLPGTILQRCGHVFCDKCWRSHVRTKLRHGAIQIFCPGYDCDVSVGVTTLLSLVSATEVGQLLQRKHENEVETSLSHKWCPNNACGRVIQLDSQSPTPVVNCICGQRICFQCLGPAHWPATCEQAQDYTDKLGDIKLPREKGDVDDALPGTTDKPKDEPVSIEIEGRLCPRCRRFIQKNGGCPMMVCKCGNSFCWKCMTSATEGQHDTSMCVESTKAFKLSRKLIVHHFAFSDEQDDKKAETRPKPARRQKASMYQKALQQRVESEKAHRSGSSSKLTPLIKKLTQISDKDLIFKREVLSVCGVENIPLREYELATISTKIHVTKFLQSFQDMRTALLHISEFTFVLLRDIPISTERSRILKMADDLTAFACFIQSVLDDDRAQHDHRTAIRRLANIREWAGRTIDALLTAVNRLRL